MGGGRPEKLTPDVRAAFVSALQRGCYIETAAALAGVCKDTYYEWLKRGASPRRKKDGEPYAEDLKYVEFSDAVKKALARAEIGDLESIMGAAKGGDWHAAAWRLERRYPHRWGRRTITLTMAEALRAADREVTGEEEEGTGPVERIEITIIDPKAEANAAADDGLSG